MCMGSSNFGASRVACRDAEEAVQEDGKDVSAAEVEAQALPEDMESEGHVDATGILQEEIKLSMDSVPQSPVR